MNTNIFKTIIISLVFGLGCAIGFCVAELLGNAINLLDLTNEQLSHHALIAFLIGTGACLVYSFATKRQW